MTSSLHITLAQINPIVGDLAYNLGKIRKIRDGLPDTADLLVFPELALCGYSPEDLVVKPFFLDRIDEAVAALVNESRNHRAFIALPAPYREGEKLYNALHVIGEGKIHATVRKHNLPNYGVFDEVRVFDAGPLPDPVPFRGHRLGFIICEDMWSGAVAAALKDKGADILIAVNESPYEVTKNDLRLEQARGRVRETGLPLLYLNQVGGQDEVVFDGASFILNEQGHVIMQAEEFVEDIRHNVWEKTPSGRWLCGAGVITPVHTGPEAIYQAVMTGLRDYVTKNGFPGVLIGLSGGIDSALSAAIAVDALGPDAVHGILLPSKFTSQDSIEDAVALAQNLGIHSETISIAPAVAAFEAQLAPHMTAATPPVTHENIQPRCRGVILMALSNATGKMVLSTGNKSEIAVGYATLYGDMCGGFNVLKDLYKTQVYQLARWRNRFRPDHALGPAQAVIPERSITKAPTAELRPNQTDQDTLPPYDVLDGILEGLIEDDLSVGDIAARGYDRAMVLRVWRMLDFAEYKRRQAAPGVKITRRAFGRDRRYPLTNHFLRGA